MLVVSDATPLNILIRSELVRILPALFDVVAIPPAVRAELTHPSTPSLIREWIRTAPPWLETRTPASPLTYGPKGQGEREAIALARELKADLLLADDKAARTTAASLGVPTTGTLGVLEQAAARGLIALRPSLDRVRAEGLFLTDALVQAAIRRDSDRQRLNRRGPTGPSNE